MRSKQPDSSAARIGQAIIGRPQKSAAFLRGMRLLPPRAGMTANAMGLNLSRSLSPFSP